MQFIKNLLHSCLAVVLSLGVSAHAKATDKSVYRFSVVPQLPQLETYRNWYPLIKYLQTHLGVRLKLSVESDIPSFEKKLYAGKADFAYMNPYHLVVARQRAGYIPLIRDDSKRLTGVLVVLRNSDITDVQALHGQKIVFPAPNAFGASLYMRALLRNEHHIDFTTVYAKTHANVFRRVIYRQAAAGGGVNKTLQAEKEAVISQLRVLYETPGVAPHPIAAHPDVPKALQEKFVQVLLRMMKSPQGRQILKKIQLFDPIVADYERDYAPLTALKLEDFVVEPK